MMTSLQSALLLLLFTTCFAAAAAAHGPKMKHAPAAFNRTVFEFGEGVMFERTFAGHDHFHSHHDHHKHQDAYFQRAHKRLLKNNNNGNNF